MNNWLNIEQSGRWKTAEKKEKKMEEENTFDGRQQIGEKRGGMRRNKADRHKSRARSSMSNCVRLKIQKKKCNRRTDRPKDGPTDRHIDL